MVEFEEVPAVLKVGVIVPVYKGGGRDPMKVEASLLHLCWLSCWRS